MFGCYFFLSETRQEEQKNVKNIKVVTGMIGGLLTMVFGGMKAVLQMYNRSSLNKKMIKACYYDFDESSHAKGQDAFNMGNPVKFSSWDHFSSLIKRKYKCCLKSSPLNDR